MTLQEIKEEIKKIENSPKTIVSERLKQGLEEKQKQIESGKTVFKKIG